MVIRTLQGFPLWYPGVHLGAVFIVRMYAAERYVFGFLPMSSISRISPFMDCMEERDFRCPFLFSVLCLNYYEIFLILQKIESLMKTTTVALGPHFEDFIQASILSGRYNNASEVVRSGLRLLEDQEYASRLAALRYAIDEGEASGDYEDFDPVANLAELNARRNG